MVTQTFYMVETAVIKKFFVVLQYTCVFLAFAVQGYLFYEPVQTKKERPVKTPVIHKPATKLYV